MTGKTIVDKAPHGAKVDQQVLTVLFDNALELSSDNKLNMKSNLTEKDLKNALNWLRKVIRNGELEYHANWIVDMIGADILEFYSHFPQKLVSVESILDEQAESGNKELVEDEDGGYEIRLFAALKSVYADYVIDQLVPSFVTYLEDLIEMEQWRKRGVPDR